MISASEVVSLAARLCCIARLVCLIESVFNLKEMRPGGMLNWTLSGLMDFSSQPQFRFRLESTIAKLPHRIFAWLVLVDALVVTALLLFPTNAILLISAAILMLIQMKRHYMSYDGADEMIFLCLVALFVGSVTGANRLTAFFLAAEACLAYLVAGIYKASSPFWKNGHALLLITRTRAFGYEPVGMMLRDHPAMTRALEFVFVLWESLFPIALLVPPKALMPILAIGLLFHISCAWVMGLNTFPWAFLATYPALIFANQQIRASLSADTAKSLAFGLLVTITITVIYLTLEIPRRRPLERDYVGGSMMKRFT